MIKSTRIRFVSSPSPEGLEVFINSLPFKVEIKSIVARETLWYCWFVLPDNIDHKVLSAIINNETLNVPSVKLEGV